MTVKRVDSSEVIPFPAAATPDPQGANSYGNVRLNALKHGVLSRHVVLPHEDGAEYKELLTELSAEHAPVGPTEMHLIEEIASVMWRKRRVLQGEGAIINQGLRQISRDADRVFSSAVPFERGLSGRGVDLRDVVGMTPEAVEETQQCARRDMESVRKALGILARGASGAVDRALRELREFRDDWASRVDQGEYECTAKGLTDYVHDHVYVDCVVAEKEARHHDAIKAQAFGEGLQAEQLASLSRYEIHLDRKLERYLAMLLKLKELRRSGR